MNTIFSILVIVNYLACNVRCFDDDDQCYENYLNKENFNYKTHKACKEIFSESLNKFHRILDDLKAESEVDMGIDLDCVFKWFQSKEIEKIFLRSLAKNAMQSDQSRLSFDDLVSPSIRRLMTIPLTICNLEMLFNDDDNEIQQPKENEIKAYTIPKQHEMNDVQKCSVKKFLDTHVTAANADILDFEVNMTGIDCKENSKYRQEDETTMNEIYLFDMSRKQVDNCNENETLVTNNVYVAMLLIFEYFDVDDDQEDEIKRIFFESVKTTTENGLKCMSEIN